MKMKLAILMYLKGDETCVDRLLKEIGLETFSRLPVEGHRAGPGGGWYGEVAPYRSELLMSVLPEAQAVELTRAIEACTGVEDPQHPIRAAILDVEQFVRCDLNNDRSDERNEP